MASSLWRRSIIVGLLCMIAMIALFSWDFPVKAQSGEKQRIIVQYKDDEDGKIEIQSNGDSKPLNKEGAYILEVPKKEASKRIAELKKEADVKYAEMDPRVYAFGEVSDDPLSGKQAHVFQDIHLADDWKLTSPANDVTVAVIDSGADLDHPDLKAHLTKGYNVLDPSKPPEDQLGHGTHIAGMVGAGTFNGIGVSSISKGAEIMPIKVLNGKEGNMSDVAQGIDYAVEHGADIINLSLGGYDISKYLQDAVQRAEDNGVLVVAAAGNDNFDKSTYPAAFSSVLSVASTITGATTRADFSNYGDYINVAAPGTDIYSTYLDGKYDYMDGTSMSTSLVTSLAASLLEKAPYLTSEQISYLIQSGADSLDSHSQLGKGRIDASDASQLIEKNKRIAGRDSVATSLEISKNGWDSLEETSYSANQQTYHGKFAVMATADRFPDSLAATPLANKLGSPILLVSHNKVTDEHIEELKRLNVEYVVLVGGEGALSAEVKDKLIKNDIETIRVAGTSRYKTSLAINKTLGLDSSKAIVVTGQNFPDAVSVAAYAENAGMPIIYVKKNQVPEEVKNYLQLADITSAQVVGGPGAISEQTVNQLGIQTSRVNGTNRYETSFQVMKHFAPNKQGVFFATGEKYNDALTGAALAGKRNEKVLLVKPDHLDKAMDSRLSYLQKLGITDYRILGGPGAISMKTAWHIDQRLNN
ncbi:S8 family serine peptidase [Halobacillus salinarum]|uniref:S8 family serine peptidase n=1 Tax=Halobacillus salinarum TaxID=2932257 RepID=A0ABY4ENG4_9BACI|nr:S8 family serine peptidase [Halobacillus salinarum]UOQ45688.1 S8 family serine peptidase [Halobacillus salinarum]